ncbi:hypothetical protein KR067_002929 [Drosophila pandora]|nr:hypothetical protein KR067_002929 [Drosophila pandora]
MGSISSVLVLSLGFILGLRLIHCFLVFPRQGSFGYLAAVAIPLDLSPKNVYMAFNFESNYALPSNDSWNQWVDRWNLDGPFGGVPGNVTPINARNDAGSSHEEKEVQRRSVDAPPPIRRLDFYRSIINFMTHYGFNGTACLLRIICEVSETPFDPHNGLVGTLFHILFVPTTSAPERELQHVDELYEASDAGTRGLGCSDYVAHCEDNALDLITMAV